MALIYVSATGPDGEENVHYAEINATDSNVAILLFNNHYITYNYYDETEEELLLGTIIEGMVINDINIDVANSSDPLPELITYLAEILGQPSHDHCSTCWLTSYDNFIS